MYMAYILYRSICPPVPYSYIKQHDVADPLNSKYTLLSTGFVCFICTKISEHNPGVKLDVSVLNAFKHPWKEQKYNCEARGTFGLELETGKFRSILEYYQYFMFLTSAWMLQNIWIWDNFLIKCLHSIILSYINRMRHEHTLFLLEHY
jgi:hypothetical protein